MSIEGRVDRLERAAAVGADRFVVAFEVIDGPNVGRYRVTEAGHEAILTEAEVDELAKQDGVTLFRVMYRGDAPAKTEQAGGER